LADWHRLTPEETRRRLGTRLDGGLSEKEAAERLAQYGPNELVERGLQNPLRILWEQLTSSLVFLLILAAAVSIFLSDYQDTLVILAIVILNAVLGFTQEYRAERAVAALRKLAVPTVKVVRDGRVIQISAQLLVPGDLLLLEAGNLVAADGRLLEAVNLRVLEAVLTGESEAVEKNPQVLPEAETPVGDRRDMVYFGTTVTYGRGKAVVTETGKRTEMGKIAALIQTVEREPTPLQKRLSQLGRGLGLAALILVAAVFVLGFLRGEESKLLFVTALSLVVAAVPEGLPAVVAIALAMGAQRMLKRQALIRKLPAVETLGSVTVICADKTGTLTENRMTVTVLDTAGERIDLSEHLHRAGLVGEGLGRRFSEEVEGPVETRLQPSLSPALRLLLAAAALCNDAVLSSDAEKAGHLHALGDPTEAALVVAAAQLGLKKPALEKFLPRVAELPFDSDRKRMSTVHKWPDLQNETPDFLHHTLPEGGHGFGLIFTKGAVDAILANCREVWNGSQREHLDEGWKKRIASAHNELAQSGMRMLGIAFRPILLAQADDEEAATLEQNLIFVGMAGMIDPPRPEAKEAVRTCQEAGIRPVMITGDHPLTAGSIARELSISDGGEVLTGGRLSELSPESLKETVGDTSVYARVVPEDKLKIVDALQRRGEVVAMTGDGVNDAPALRKADIGVAMGKTGSEVAKETADMVLLDDNFATIVAAVKEGRIIYENIRKFVKYVLTSNSGELAVMVLAPLLAMPLPLLPLQILWINLVTDGPPALALSLEPGGRQVMRRPPYPLAENIFARGLGWFILRIGLVMAAVSLGAGFGYWKAGRPEWQTVVFTVLALSQMGLALAVRSGRDSLFRLGLFSNQPLWGAVLLTLVLQLAVVYLPLFQGFFRTSALPGRDLGIVLLLSSAVFWWVEIEKWILRRRRN
jgi:Ca2+-transporting ATPase